MELSIIIPAFNEEYRLPGTIERIFKDLKSKNYSDFEILVANDGSKDNTAEIVLKLSKRYPCLRLADYKVNRGRGAVCRDAVSKARGEFILIADADGSTSEEAILRFVEYLLRHEDVDMLIGSRDIPGARVLTPQVPLRVFLYKVFLLMAKVLFGWPMHDRVNGFKLFRRETALDIYPHQKETSFFAEVELLYIAEARGWRVRELPIIWADHRDSRLKPFKEAWRSFWGCFRIYIRGKKGVYKNGS